MGVPLLTTMPVSSAAILRQEYKREQRAAAALERLDERDPSSTGAQEDLRSIIDGAHSAQQAEWRRAAPEIVARNVAWKCVVSAANACWQALDEGLGQPEHFPILVTALRQGSDDMRKILPGVNQVRRALGEPAIDLKIVENAVLAVSCFGDKTDWNHALLRADEAERAAWYKRWDQAAGRRKTASEQMALV